MVSVVQSCGGPNAFVTYSALDLNAFTSMK